MDIGKKVKQIIGLPSVKTVAIALALNMLLQYAFNDVLLDFVSIGVAFIAVGLSAYLAGLLLNKITYPNIFIMGAIAYFGYVWSLLFFKLSDVAPVLEEQFKGALIFGAISVAVYWALENFGS